MLYIYIYIYIYMLCIYIYYIRRMSAGNERGRAALYRARVRTAHRGTPLPIVGAGLSVWRPDDETLECPPHAVSIPGCDRLKAAAACNAWLTAFSTVAEAPGAIFIGHDIAEACRAAAGNETVNAFWEAWVLTFEECA